MYHHNQNKKMFESLVFFLKKSLNLNPKKINCSLLPKLFMHGRCNSVQGHKYFLELRIELSCERFRGRHIKIAPE